jgi:hypothetical protein
MGWISTRAEFQPRLNFNPVNQTEICFTITWQISAWDELECQFCKPGRNLSPGWNDQVPKWSYSASSNNLKCGSCLLFDFCKTVVIHLKMEQTEIKPRCFFNPGWNVPSIIQDDFQPVNRDDIFWARVAWTTTRAETHPGLKFLSCNRLLHVF